LDASIEALQAVAKDSYSVYRLDKATLIKTMMMNPNLELTFLWKTREKSHNAETQRLSQLVLGSEETLRKGVLHQNKREYQQAIECYDKAIRIEPLDFRAWNNKILALAQDGKHQEAIRVAEEILDAHPDVAVLWERKGRVLYEMGRLLDAEDCFSRAISSDEKIADNYTSEEWFETIKNNAMQAWKDLETDVEHYEYAKKWPGGYKQLVQDMQTMTEQFKVSMSCLAKSKKNIREREHELVTVNNSIEERRETKLSLEHDLIKVNDEIESLKQKVIEEGTPFSMHEGTWGQFFLTKTELKESLEKVNNSLRHLQESKAETVKLHEEIKDDYRRSEENLILIATILERENYGEGWEKLANAYLDTIRDTP
jgi:tetratricopeptide (TPR) repeat protein